MIEIDGSQGEGGGQMLRTSLALSLITGQALRLVRIRARRRKPGLRAQHMSCVKLAAQVGGAEVEGCSLGSSELSFRPTRLRGGSFSIDLGTAGSTSLVLQTVMPALLRASEPSTIELRGGTHNPMAPPFEFLTRVYLPWVRALGADAEGELERAGYFPKGGGSVTYRVRPARLGSLDLMERGPRQSVCAEARLAKLPDTVGERELRAVGHGLKLPEDQLSLIRERRPRGPGNALLITARFANACEVVTAYGEKGKPAEDVGADAVREMRRFLDARVAVGEHGADQLLLLLALGEGGRFTSVAPSGHTQTQMEVIPRFLGCEIQTRELERDRWEINVRPG